MLKNVRSLKRSDTLIPLEDLIQLSAELEQRTREGAVKREIDLGGGKKRTIWVKGCRIVDVELSIPKSDWELLTKYIMGDEE